MTLFIKVLTIISALFLAFSPVTFAQETKVKSAAEMLVNNPALKGRLIEVEVNGMVCDFCAQSLTKVLLKKESVVAVNISLETKLMIITQKEGMTLTDKEVAEAVNWAGYEMASLQRI